MHKYGNQEATLSSAVEFRLTTHARVVPFSNHLTQLLDFTAGEVQFVSAAPPGWEATPVGRQFFSSTERPRYGQLFFDPRGTVYLPWELLQPFGRASL
jgi:hypothetical protein